MLSRNKKTPHPKHDSMINGRRFTLAIKTGLKKLTHKFKHPAPKFAHSAFDFENPIDSNIDTE